MLIGRFLEKKNINFNAMQNVLSSIWRPNEGVEIHDIGEMRYSFMFYHPMDLQKVVEGRGWSMVFQTGNAGLQTIIGRGRSEGGNAE